MTHAAIHRLEVIRGKPESAIPLVKHAVRFSRRLRQHCIENAVFPLFVRHGESCCKIEVGNRLVTLMDDGSFHASLLPLKRNGLHTFDPLAMKAHHNRVHALYMSMAAQSRANRWYQAARIDLSIATEERKRAI